MTDSMVLRVAKAIHEAARGLGGAVVHVEPWQDGASILIDGDVDMMAMALAAIAAMREPTEAMVQAVIAYAGEEMIEIREEWRIMIDAALSHREI